MRIGHLMALVGLSVACATPLVSAEGTPRIAVVRPLQIMKDSAEYKEHLTNYETETQKLTAAQDQKKHDIDAMTAQLKQLNPAHPSYGELSAKIEQASIELQAWQQIVTRDGERERKQMLREIFHHLQAATAKVARAQQIDLVLTQGEDDLPNIESLDYQALVMNIAGRSVLFSTNTVDISNAVLTQVDADYAAAKRNNAAVAPEQPTTGNPKVQGNQR